MKLYVTVEEFLYAKKIENQTERTLRGYKNALNLFANWLQKKEKYLSVFSLSWRTLENS